MSKQAFIMLGESDRDWIVFSRFFFPFLFHWENSLGGACVQKTTQRIAEDNRGGVWCWVSRSVVHALHPRVSWEKVKRYIRPSRRSRIVLLGQGFPQHIIPHERQRGTDPFVDRARNKDICVSRVRLTLGYLSFQLYNLLNM